MRKPFQATCLMAIGYLSVACQADPCRQDPEHCQGVPVQPVPPEEDDAPFAAPESPDGLVPYMITAGGMFAVDDLGRVVGAEFDEVWYPPTVTVYVLGEAAYSDTESDESCIIDISYDGDDDIPMRTWSFLYDGTSYTQRGFTFLDQPVEVSTDCVLDESVLGSPEEIAELGWGVTVGTFMPEVEQTFIDYQGTTDPYVGGGFYWETIRDADVGLDAGVSPFAYAHAYETNANLEVLNTQSDVASEDDDLQHLEPEALLGTRLPRGLYVVDPAQGWVFE